MTPLEMTAREDELRDEITALPPKQRKQYYDREKQLLRDPDTYAVLNYFFVFSLHHLYLGRYNQAGIEIAIMFVGLLCLSLSNDVVFLIVAGLVLVVPLVIKGIYELFMSQKIVRMHNIGVMEKVLVEITHPSVEVDA